jgi:hypothetical protein
VTALSEQTNEGPERTTVVLELDRGGERISGIARNEGEPGQSFSGWLELTSLLESIRNQKSAQRRDP